MSTTPTPETARPARYPGSAQPGPLTADPAHPDPAGCLVAAHDEPGAIVVELVGTLDAESAAEVNALLHRQIGRAAGRLVVVDLDGVTVVDETTLAVADRADVRARQVGTRLRLIATADGITAALRAAGLGRTIPICDSYIDALTRPDA